MKQSRYVFKAVVATTILWASCVAQVGADEESLGAETFIDLPSTITCIASAPDDDTRVFICERAGVVSILNAKTGVMNDEPYLDISDQITMALGEQGLCRLIFHPNYQENGRLFVYATYPEGDAKGDAILMEFARDGDDPDLTDPDGDRVMVIEQPTPYHQGGFMAFGDDGYLYLATGDGGGGNGGGPRAQNITDGRLLGKILRIDLDADDFPSDSDRDYSIPPDNPFVGIEGDDEIWAYGFRNPWSGSLDPVTGDIYIGDVGRVSWEELSVLVGGGLGGENYGWRCMEGSACTGFNVCTCNDPSLELPIWEYFHDPDPVRCSIIGANVYRGCAMPFLDGHIMTSDMCSDEIWSLDWNPAEGLIDVRDRTAEISGSGAVISSPTAIGHDDRGEIWIGTYQGVVHKIVPQVPVIAESDFDCSGVVDVDDLLVVLGAWGPCDGCRADLDGDHLVTVSELLQVIADWG